VEERGVTTLHLTFGALNWQDDWLAILYLVEDQFGLQRSELGRGVARLFGLERATTRPVTLFWKLPASWLTVV